MSADSLGWLRSRQVKPDPITGKMRPVDEPVVTIEGRSPGIAKAVLTELCLRSEDFTHRVWAGRSRLIEWTQFSANAVDNAIKTLVASRLIFKVPSWRNKDGSQTTNIIIINVNGTYDEYDSLDAIMREVERRVESMIGDDTVDHLSNRKVNPYLGEFVPLPSEGTPPPLTGEGASPHRGGGLPCEGRLIKKGIKNLTTTTPTPPTPNATDDHPKGEVEVEAAPQNNPESPQGHVEPPQAPEPTATPTATLSAHEKDAEDRLRTDARQWVQHTLTEKTPGAVMLTRQQVITLTNDVAELLAEGWTPNLINQHIGRLVDLKYRFRPVRDKLKALADLDPSALRVTRPARHVPIVDDTPIDGPVLAKEDALRHITTVLSAPEAPRRRSVRT